MIQDFFSPIAVEAFKSCFGISLRNSDFVMEKTPAHFQGDITLVCFLLAKHSKKNPIETAEILAQEIGKNSFVEQAKTVKAFVNVKFSDTFWVHFFQKYISKNAFLKVQAEKPQRFLVEFSSPNTNKPLHLGHIRNILLGFSLSNILKSLGHTVHNTQIVNDRGIHICKSIVAWRKFSDGATPENENKKGDHFVGDYYVKFNDQYKKEVAELIKKGESEEQAKRNAPILLEAEKMLEQWENGDKAVKKLWETMNSWVYEGFEETYQRLGVSFDKNYYESETYKYGKEVVNKGLEQKIFYKKPDNSVWIDLEAEKLDKKLLLRSNGTSVYITQDFGTAVLRQKDFQFDSQVYVVGNEQEYHFQVLFAILKKMGYKWAENCSHLSYGMVELPDGKMKSREGTVVDADTLMDEMIAKAKEATVALNKSKITYTQNNLFEKIGMGALKYFILKVNPKKKMLFDPKQSIDLNGDTGPFIQYTAARIRSLLQKANSSAEMYQSENNKISLKQKEIELIKILSDYPKMVQESADNLNPSLLANWTYNLAKNYNSFYQDIKVLTEPNKSLKIFRLQLSLETLSALQKNFDLLNIPLPEKM